MLTIDKLLRTVKLPTKESKDEFELWSKSWAHFNAHLYDIEEDDILVLMKMELKRKDVRPAMMPRYHSRYNALRSRREKIELGIPVVEQDKRKRGRRSTTVGDSKAA